MAKQSKVFDYENLNLDKNIVRELKELAAEIRDMDKCTASDVLKAGQKLIEARENIPHGYWQAWTAIETRLKKDRVDRWIRIAEIELWKTIGSECLDFINLTALYDFSAKKILSDKVRYLAVEKAQTGQRVTRRDFLVMVKGVKEGNIQAKPRSRRSKRKMAYSNEDEFQRVLEEKLDGLGEKITKFRNCTAGQCDILTQNLVIEVKYEVNRSDFIKAVGQVLLYRESINPKLKAVIAFVPGIDNINPLYSIVEKLGVKIWDFSKFREDFIQLDAVKQFVDSTID